ncbi:MAG: UxaA family hydrolase [Candidatus Thorarchaeota archaeon]
MKNKYIIIDSKDNCATALEDILQDTKIELKDKIIKLNHNISLGHKFAINDIEKEDYVIKYGEIIGIATESIGEGDWIHTHNIKSTYLEVTKDG